MAFVGKAWKILVGVKDALVLLFLLLFFGAIWAALSASPHRDSAREGALRLDLAGAIVEQPSERSAFETLGGGSAAREYRLSEVVRAIDTAAADSRVKAFALDLDIFTGGGQTALADVGAALDRARRSGKRVVAYATGYSDDSYQLAAHADEVWLDPLGAVLIAGPGRTNLKPGEIVVSFTLPPRAPGSSDAYLRMIPRTEMDIAVVGLGVSLTMQGGVVTAARVGLGAVAPTVLLVEDAAKALIGSRLDDAALEAAAAACSAACNPINDKRGTIVYRTKVAGVLLKRTTAIAAQRATQKN